jgi:hydrogenase maturation factor HypF (carbamoyltransferase family)
VRERTNVKIRGLVQGVFFRETVRRAASQYEVHGFVRNVGRDLVEIDVEGEAEIVRAFIDDVLEHPPLHARIEEVQSARLPATGTRGFSVAPSVR